MNMCANHPETPAAAYCRNCGKPLCEMCRIENMGAIYCAEHAPVPVGVNVAPPPLYTTSPYASASPYTAPAAASPYTAPAQYPSPVLATVLGVIPGVGAIYNGQYAKGLVHAVIVGLIISILSTSSTPPVQVTLSMLLVAWWFYMVIEANHTARARRDGVPVDEISSILNLSSRSGFPFGAAVLIGLGALLLLDTTGLISMERLIRYWPVGLILLGVYLLYARMDRRSEPVVGQEFGDERR